MNVFAKPVLGLLDIWCEEMDMWAYDGIGGMEGNGRGVCEGLNGHYMAMQRWEE